MEVGAEVGWAAVATVTSNCSSADLHHVRRTSLKTFNAGVAPLGSHGMGNGLTLILHIQIQGLNNAPLLLIVPSLKVLM